MLKEVLCFSGERKKHVTQYSLGFHQNMEEGHLIIKMICTWTSIYSKSDVQVQIIIVLTIDLKRITRCKLALIFTSADHRKFLGLFGSEAARNEASLEGYVIKMFLFCLYKCSITVIDYFKFKKVFCG
jgi:hypothetical protein